MNFLPTLADGVLFISVVFLIKDSVKFGCVDNLGIYYFIFLRGGRIFKDSNSK